MVEDAHQMRPSAVTDEQYLNQAETEIRRHGRHVLSSIVAIGKKLTEVKGRLGHGRYGQFIRDRLGFSERTAQQFVQCYEFIKSAQCADLDSLQIDPSALRLLARQTTCHEVRVRALEQAAKPEGISYSAVKKLIAQDEAAKAQDEAKTAEARVPLAERISERKSIAQVWAEIGTQRQHRVVSSQDEALGPEVTVKASTSLAIGEAVADTNEPPDPPLSFLATKARELIVDCAKKIKLTPVQCITAETEIDHLGQIFSAITGLTPWFTGFKELYAKKLKGEQLPLPLVAVPTSRKRRPMKEPNSATIKRVNSRPCGLQDNQLRTKKRHVCRQTPNTQGCPR